MIADWEQIDVKKWTDWVDISRLLVYVWVFTYDEKGTLDFFEKNCWDTLAFLDTLAIYTSCMYSCSEPPPYTLFKQIFRI